MLGLLRTMGPAFRRTKEFYWDLSAYSSKETLRWAGGKGSESEPEMQGHQPAPGALRAGTAVPKGPPPRRHLLAQGPAHVCAQRMLATSNRSETAQTQAMRWPAPSCAARRAKRGHFKICNASCAAKLHAHPLNRKDSSLRIPI